MGGKPDAWPQEPIFGPTVEHDLAAAQLSLSEAEAALAAVEAETDDLSRQRHDAVTALDADKLIHIEAEQALVPRRLQVGEIGVARCRVVLLRAQQWADQSTLDAERREAAAKVPEAGARVHELRVQLAVAEAEYQTLVNVRGPVGPIRVDRDKLREAERELSVLEQKLEQGAA